MNAHSKTRRFQMESLEDRLCMSISPMYIGETNNDVEDPTIAIVQSTDPGGELGGADGFADAGGGSDGGGFTPTGNLADSQTAGIFNLDIPPEFLVADQDEAAAATDPTHRVSGQVSLSYMAKSIDWLSSVGQDDFPFIYDVDQNVAQMPLRYEKVVLEDPDGHWITGKLNGDGQFEFEWIPLESGLATITIYAVAEHGNREAAVGDWIGGDINDVHDLTADNSDYDVYSYSRSFQVDDAAISDGGHEMNIVIEETHESAQAFYFLDNAMLALDYFYAIDGVDVLPKLNVVYSSDMTEMGEDGESGIYMDSKAPGFIYINGGLAWNGFVMRHETSHMFQHHYMRDDPYGAIGEPLANIHAAAMVGNSFLDMNTQFENMDVQPNYENGQFILQDAAGNYWEYGEGVDWAIYDDNGEPVTAVNDDDEVYTVRPSSGWVQRVLWDLIDGAGDEPVTSYLAADGATVKNVGAAFDAIDGSDDMLNDVLMNYVGGGVYGHTSDDYEDRGFNNVDIVDILDGMVIRGHANALALAWLMNEGMDFDYHFPLMMEYEKQFDEYTSGGGDEAPLEPILDDGNVQQVSTTVKVEAVEPSAEDYTIRSATKAIQTTTASTRKRNTTAKVVDDAFALLSEEDALATGFAR